MQQTTASLQPGIAFGQGERPDPCYRLLLLNAAPGARPEDVSAALDAVHRMLRKLALGQVDELEGQPADTAAHSAAQFEGLKHLVAVGRRLFDEQAHDPALVNGARPEYLVYLAPDGPFPALRWQTPRRPNPGEADFAIQLTAQRQAAVQCAAVEVWKLLTQTKLALRVTGSFDGFGRHDGRGWLEFHDGVSNVATSQRAAALLARGEPEWLGGGTTMAFLRLRLDLRLWQGLSRSEQELLVGRDKLTGGAVVRVEYDADGHPRPVTARRPGPDASAREREEYREPPQGTDALVESSHIHRANQHRSSAAAPAGWRMFRQGYDFLDGFEADGPHLGLNFVSFQSDLAVFHHLLHVTDWLGDVNFGGVAGDGANAAPSFATVLAGGLYVVPPMAEPFPGAALFRPLPMGDAS